MYEYLKRRVLEHFRVIHPNYKFILVREQALNEMDRHEYEFTFDNTENLIMIVNVNKNHWVTVTNIDCQALVESD